MGTFSRRLRLLISAEPAGLRRALAAEGSWLVFSLAVIVVGSGAYGATIGLGRAPLQAAWTAVKFPLLVLLTTAGNALLNGMLAQLLGLGISFRQSTLAIVTSFAVAAAVLAAFTPVTLFLWWSTPAFSSAQAVVAHNATLVVHVVLIALAGATGNAALFRLLSLLSAPSRNSGDESLICSGSTPRGWSGGVAAPRRGDSGGMRRAGASRSARGAIAPMEVRAASGNTSPYFRRRVLSGSRPRAGRILAAWLAGNLLLGSQLSWIMRPFIGSPALPIEFFRADALSGNFYEATWRAAANLLR